jgi:hypothetical protein
MDEKPTTQNEMREVVRDYLNGKYTDEELAKKFTIKHDDKCKEFSFEEELEECQNPDCENKTVPNDYGRYIEALGGFICKDCLDNGYGN